MIVGTAGHIDHGKTTLVQALTGVNTDRLPEEQKRGITIELGYASLKGPAGQVISFVDVPGHEKLVRTMVAGACGIDYALLLIAADDGIMPQTVEHASILGLLGITRGAVLITKIDRVTADLAAQRKVQAQDLLAVHGLGEYEVLTVSAHRGDGIAELKDRICAVASNLPQPAPDGKGFRMSLDRVFSLDGIGTVVAGSVAAGQVRVGDSLCLAHEPSLCYRVRSLHSHNQSVQQARAGQRCAIGLVGLERGRVERGMSLCDAAIAQSTQRVDVWLQLASTEGKVLRSGTQVHLHVGTQELMASVAVLGQTSISPGEAGLAQLVLQKPAQMWWGEHFVVRDASARRTLGGGSVLDLQGLARYRQTPERLAFLHSQRHGEPTQRLLAALVSAPYGISSAEWLRGAGLTSWPFDPAALPGVVFDAKRHWLVAAEQLARSESAVLTTLKDFHARHPEDLGPDIQRARRLAIPRMPEPPWSQLLEQLIAHKKVARSNGFIHLPAHGEQLREADRIVAQRALPMLLLGRFDPPWVRDIATDSRLPEAQVRSVMARLAKRGEVFQVVKDLYYHPHVVRELAQIARTIAQHERQITAAAYRDATQLGRKRAIQILEFFDRIGYLRRVGDIHLLRPGAALFGLDEAHA